jgi:hypothetical protein
MGTACGNVVNISAKCRGEKEEPIQQQHIGFNVKKAKGNGAVADGFKG